jgi:hypothetical protein
MTFISEKILNEEKVRIEIKPGDLGLGLDDSLEKYKDQLRGGKSWNELSKQLNTLKIFNKNKHPDVAAKAENKRTALAGWVKKKREKNPDEYK